MIDDVLVRTGASRVILVGYSMGGLAARAYLVKRLTDHNVKRLITIGTPHLGSPFARIWTWTSSLEQCIRDRNVLLATPCKAALAAVLATQGDVPYEAAAVRDLRRPEDGGTYLQKLSKFSHPLDVEYVSVIGDVDLLDEVKNLRDGALQESLRKVMAVLGGSLTELFESGDGVVSTKSQDIMNIEFFSADKSRRRAARVVNVGSVHKDHLANTSNVQRASLDEKAEFKGAFICGSEGRAQLVVDITDHVPQLCSVDVILESTVVARASKGSAALIKTHEGIAARFTIPLDGLDIKNAEPLQLRISIVNTYGYTTTATISW